MYLHLGNDVIVNSKEIIGIFDIENTSTSSITKQYLNHTANKKIISVSYEMPKSFIVCRNKNGDEVLYISNISVSTLKKRAKALNL